MHLLLTRPRADAKALAEMLRSRGHRAIVAPMVAIRPKPGAAVSLSGVQAIMATSANGVRALAARTTERGVPLYAVGDATARAAHGEGFTQVESAAGDVDALAALVTGRCTPAAGALLHVAGTAVAGDLAGTLGRAGFTVCRATLYEARLARTLPAAARRALEDRALDGALFFSPRTAASFDNLLRCAALAEAVQPLTAFCLSPAVAEAAAALPWRAVRVAAAPTEAALLELIDRAPMAGAKWGKPETHIR